MWTRSACFTKEAIEVRTGPATSRAHRKLEARVCPRNRRGVALSRYLPRLIVRPSRPPHRPSEFARGSRHAIAPAIAHEWTWMLVEAIVKPREPNDSVFIALGSSPRSGEPVPSSAMVSHAALRPPRHARVLLRLQALGTAPLLSVRCIQRDVGADARARRRQPSARADASPAARRELSAPGGERRHRLVASD